jgi:hypothetical protein
MKRKWKCNCCKMEYEDDKGITFVYEKEFTCFTCLGEVVAKITKEDIDADRGTYDFLSFLAMDKSAPEPLQKLCFNKVLGSNTLKKYFKTRGVDIEYDEYDEKMRIKKK